MRDFGCCHFWCHASVVILVFALCGVWSLKMCSLILMIAIVVIVLHSMHFKLQHHIAYLCVSCKHSVRPHCSCHNESIRLRERETKPKNVLNFYTLAHQHTRTQSLNKWKSYDVISNLFRLYNRLCCCHCYLYIMHTQRAVNILSLSHHRQIHTHIEGMALNLLETYVAMVRSSYTNYNLISSIYIVISDDQGV